MTTKTLNIDWVRQQFPALKNPMAFMDNAGGSQTLNTVIKKITQYLTDYNVQLGASYETSLTATKRLQQATETIQAWINAQHTQELIIGSSSTLLLRILSLCISQQWQKNDEVIITNTDHESNRAPWIDLQKMGIKIKTWKLNPDSFSLELDDLKQLLSTNTKLVAVTHTSNILGSITPIKTIAKIVHQCNALICVDGVAYAPHRMIDVQDLDVDFYVFSTYKTFGPHQAIMYGKLELLQSMHGINHDFIDTVPYKFQPGNLNYELSYSLAAIPEHIKTLGNGDLLKGYDLIANHEQILTEKVLDYLNSNAKITTIGETTADKNLRVATISFVHSELSSDKIVEQIDHHNMGIRFGDFYAVQLIDDLSLRQNKGVVRVSLVHYNSIEEVEKLIAIFQNIL